MIEKLTAEKYYQNWKESPFLIQLNDEQKDKLKIELAGKLAGYYGLSGSNASELALIPGMTLEFFKKYSQIKVFDFEIVYNDFKYMPELKKISPDYFTNIWSKYINSELRKQIMDLHLKDDSGKLEAKNEDIQTAINLLIWMFEEYKKRGSFPYTLLGINHDHKPFMLLYNADVFWNELEPNELIIAAYNEKVSEIQEQIKTLREKEITIENKNLINSCEDRIKVLIQGFEDYNKTKNPNAQIRNYSRVYRIKKTFEQYQYATPEEFKEQIQAICEENNVK